MELNRKDKDMTEIKNDLNSKATLEDVNKIVEEAINKEMAHVHEVMMNLIEENLKTTPQAGIQP